MPRYKAKTDANHAEIAQALRQAGCSVRDMSAVGQGFPDLLVALKGRTVALEIKDGDKPPSGRKLTPQQKAFFNTWQGETAVVESVDEALGVMGITS